MSDNKVMHGMCALGTLLGLMMALGSAQASTEHVYSACTEDNFTSPSDPLYPSAALDGLFASNPKGCDNRVHDTRIQHTFDELPACITGATLEFRLRAYSSGAGNDSVLLTFVEDGDTEFKPFGEERWASRIGSIPHLGVVGLVPYMWRRGGDETFTLDLAQLPVPEHMQGTFGATHIDLLPALNQFRYLAGR